MFILMSNLFRFCEELPDLNTSTGKTVACNIDNDCPEGMICGLVDGYMDDGFA